MLVIPAMVDERGRTKAGILVSTQLDPGFHRDDRRRAPEQLPIGFVGKQECRAMIAL